MNRFRSILRVFAVLVAAYVGAPAAASSTGPELRPALPAQTWREHQHVMGFLSVTDTGQLRFATVLSEDSELEHPGYWIESWKVDEIRRVLPSALRPFRFGETITVGGVKYLRVLPANQQGSLWDRTAKTEPTELLRSLGANENPAYRGPSRRCPTNGSTHFPIAGNN